MKTRFNETGQRLYEFQDGILVRCPRCAACAQVVLAKGSLEAAGSAESQPDEHNHILFEPRKLACVYCGYTANWQGQEVRQLELFEPYFNQPLWLQASCCGHVLWAYNERHLSFIESFVKAELREAFPNGTLASRLPAWMKSAKNRQAVLKCINKLRKTLPHGVSL